MINLKIKTYLKLILVVSLISLISAYYIEYMLGHQPCNLCLIERIPYGLSVLLIILSYFFERNEKLIILLLTLVFVFSLTISFYHFGIEQGFFKESAVCGIKNTSDILSKDELLQQLQVKTVSCKDVTFRIFGLSLTTINIVINILLIITLAKIYSKYEKNK